MLKLPHKYVVQNSRSFFRTISESVGNCNLLKIPEPVSYTHLDVYKRQQYDCDITYPLLLPQIMYVMQYCVLDISLKTKWLL